jgi:hypothetical protein
VIDTPFLQTAFHTVPLSMGDWLIATAASSTLLVGMEVAKVVLRAVRPDPFVVTIPPAARQGRILSGAEVPTAREGRGS